jgi:hypothetical protein
VSDAAAQRRARQTVINLALSLLATLGIVIALVLMVPRDDSSKIQHIDYVQVAKQTTASTGLDVPVPASLPKNWWSNMARWNGNPVDAVPSFDTGFVSPNNTYVGETIGFKANPTWLALKLQGTQLTSAFVAGGGHWDVYTTTTPHDPAKDMDYVLVRQFGDANYILLFGNATHTEVHQFAKLIDKEIK